MSIGWQTPQVSLLHERIQYTAFDCYMHVLKDLKATKGSLECGLECWSRSDDKEAVLNHNVECWCGVVGILMDNVVSIEKGKYQGLQGTTIGQIHSNTVCNWFGVQLNRCVGDGVLEDSNGMGIVPESCSL